MTQDAPGDAPSAIRKQIDDFLAAHCTLTLATVGLAGAPAAAAVFYAHDTRLNLYFLSEERTQHGQNLAGYSQVAGTIQDDGQDWRTIQGLQLQGVAVRVPVTDLAHATAVYARKYAFVASLLAGDAGSGALRGPLARARFYMLRPTWMRLVDNRVRFGYKAELALR